ncbi:FTR1 High-affinity Fe2+/Pb2+ permease [Candidatus Nanopelagicaceae bacterium]
MLANFLIGLREGLEAALVVGILIAYLKKIGQAERTRTIWAGVFTAIAASTAFGAFFTISSFELEGNAEPFVSGTLSVVAGGLITWMILWLAKKARFMKQELEGAMDRAIATGVGSLFALAFFSVGREGLETAIFIWNGALASQSASTVVVGTFLGLGVSIVIGYVLYLGALKVNLQKFFRYSGMGLVIVAGGMFSYAVHEFQEINLLPGDSSKLYDISGVISPDGLLGSVLKGALNFTPTPSVLQAFVWAAYVIPVGYTFFKKPKKVVQPA